MLLDSPLNKAGLLQVYIHTAKNVLIEVHPQCRIPRIYSRFCGLMGEPLVFHLTPLDMTGSVFTDWPRLLSPAASRHEHFGERILTEAVEGD